MKYVSVTFDYEGAWGMPYSQNYDLGKATDRLLSALQRHDAKAVFFVTGKVVTQYPHIIKKIHAQGHEIGMHGHTHEHMHNLTSAQIEILYSQLSKDRVAIFEITGYLPRGFRAPYLMGPVFYNPQIYRMLSRLGFSWTSNREIRQPAELFRPDRIKMGAVLLRYKVIFNALFALLNFRLITFDRPNGGIIASYNWLVQLHQPPFLRPEGLVEYPLTSPLDCDLFGFPAVNSNSGPDFTTYATQVVGDCYKRSGAYFNINCHDWITGTMDRIEMLDKILADIAADRDARFYRPGLDGATP